MKTPGTSQLRFSVHGLAVEIGAAVPALRQPLEDVLGEFTVADFPSGFLPTVGEILPFEQADVLRRVSPRATRVGHAEHLLELYEEGDRFWLIDERWGIAEINLLKGQWRSWILPNLQTDPRRCTEMAVLWPLAQILRAKGLYLVPGVSLVRGGLGLLVLSPFSIEAELGTLIRAGFKIVGQRWTALREEDDRVAMLHMPGRLERDLPPRLRIASSEPISGWVDLCGEVPGSTAHHAFCDSVILVEPGRRPGAFMRQLAPADAATALRAAWPIVELHPNRRRGQIAARLAHSTRVYGLQLSRKPEDLLDLLDTLARPTLSSPLSARPKVSSAARVPQPTRLAG